MPLLDHFRGPLGRRAWQSFHARWSVAIADDLNRRLPRRFVADAPMSPGSYMAADVVEYEELREVGHAPGLTGNGTPENGGAVALATETYAPPETDLVMSATFDVHLKVEIRDTTDDYRVLAVVELVSPSNKKESGERARFVGKCLSYLDEGIGLVVIDIVTERRWNLHNELIRRTEKEANLLMAGDPYLYVTAYRPTHRKEEDLIDMWLWPLTLGAALPAVPLALKGYGCVRLDLEATYAEACERLRIT